MVRIMNIICWECFFSSLSFTMKKRPTKFSKTEVVTTTPNRATRRRCVTLVLSFAVWKLSFVDDIRVWFIFNVSRTKNVIIYEKDKTSSLTNLCDHSRTNFSTMAIIATLKTSFWKCKSTMGRYITDVGRFYYKPYTRRIYALKSINMWEFKVFWSEI